MRLTQPLTIAIAIVTAALLAMPATAKEGVRAKLSEPVRLDAPAGATLSVAWRLVDAQGRRFGAGGIYLRVARCGRGPLTVRATARSSGGYTARVKVPRGGIRELVVGLQGWRIVRDRKQRADRFFAFDPPLARRCR